MKEELTAAVDFLANMLKSGVSIEKVEKFHKVLAALLTNHYRNHWFEDKPNKGSGYRCIRINGKMDPLVHKAGLDSGLTNVRSHFPSELTMWVDPKEVSYRIGEEGSIGVLYEAPRAETPSKTPNNPSPVNHRTPSPVRLSPVADLSSNARYQQIHFQQMMFQQQQQQQQQQHQQRFSPVMSSSPSYSMMDHQYMSAYRSCADQANKNSPVSQYRDYSLDARQLAAYS